ncbi:hypothetical protein LEP3755_02610 [Leptolyngbya sp. NIES-3755]|nr:hypothetical protein LEP3755_02610 [Leptolyngbya sp. NIES-3755]
MVSYADFHQSRNKRRQAIELGLREFLQVPDPIKIYLDNGAFYFISREGTAPIGEYEEFIDRAKPDWYPIPQDFIPTPKMSLEEQEICFFKTMEANRNYKQFSNSYFPVIHISQMLEEYIGAIKSDAAFLEKSYVALGGIVPNLLRAPKAMSHQTVLKGLERIREEFNCQKLHVFGIGGTATLHIAALLGFDSVDSSGWRNRAARGMIQLPGTGERSIAGLGKWRGRDIGAEELETLKECRCPACVKDGIAGLKLTKEDGKGAGSQGFYNRATHNLWVLLEEARLIQEHLMDGSYHSWYKEHLDNTMYRPIIDRLVDDMIRC